MVSSANMSDNLAMVEELVKQAVSEGAELVVLPENFAFMGRDENDKLELVEDEGSGPLQNFLVSMAKRFAVWVVGGTIPLRGKSSTRVTASCLVYNEQGLQQGR